MQCTIALVYLTRITYFLADGWIGDQWHVTVLCVCVRSLKGNDTSYQQQTWYIYSLWQDLGMY